MPTKKQPAAAKKSPTKSPTKSTDLLRGVALVDAVFAKRPDSDPIAPAELAKFHFSAQYPLSPALAAWLSHDSDFFTFGELETLTEMLDREIGEDWAGAFTDLAKYLKGPVVLFDGWGADSRRFLYLGATDAHGEYPVFTIDIDDTPFACCNGPVDVWLAQQDGFLDEESVYGEVPKAYEPARAALAKQCFGGYIAYVDGAFSKSLG